MICRRLMKYLTVLAALALPLSAGADTLLDKLLSVAGLTAAPAQLRGPGDDVEAGNIWIANLDRRTATALTRDGGYRSPVFSPADGSVYALKGDVIVRFPPNTGNAVTVQKLPGALKLVGFDGKNNDEIVVLLDSGAAAAGSPLGVVSLKSGRVAPLPYNAKSEDQRRMIAQIRGQRRVYNETSVYTKTESKRGLSRQIEWTDVYLRRGDAEPQNVSLCDGVSCVQPALSPDGRRVAFVKTGG
jgi:Tol biopolymer transport system component